MSPHERPAGPRGSERLPSRWLLAPENAGVLASLARPSALLAFDFDGTLAPVVTHRDAAAMRPRTASLLGELCRCGECAIISGRSRDDVGVRLQEAAIRHVVGNHGLEPGGVQTASGRLPAGDPTWAAAISLARPALEAALVGHAGVELEDKRYSLAVHYRRSRHKRDAQAALREAVAALPVALRVVPGKQCVNLVPAGAPHKGDALLSLMAATNAELALYVGDDVTDEDVFELTPPRPVLTVRVGESHATAARYALRDQREIDDLLATLIDLRRAVLPP